MSVLRASREGNAFGVKLDKSGEFRTVGERP